MLEMLKSHLKGHRASCSLDSPFYWFFHLSRFFIFVFQVHKNSPARFNNDVTQMFNVEMSPVIHVEIYFQTFSSLCYYSVWHIWKVLLKNISTQQLAQCNEEK